MKGQELYIKAKQLIPGGTMLFSKRPELFLPNKWPSYYKKSKGVNIWDLDDTCYTDMSHMSVGTNSLGYCNSIVDNAVQQAIGNGNMSTLSCPEEVELAEILTSLHPWSDMVRFARTGGEANAIAIRIARASTGKDKILICGYHGWHDWYLSSNLDSKGNLNEHLMTNLSVNGVPKSLEGTTLPFRYNNLDELKRIINENRNDIAAIKMEVYRGVVPDIDYLKNVKKLAQQNNILLIFDECTSGFRSAYGGVHLNYGVDPDMAMFGKAMGNGYAITAVIGKREIMNAAEKTFISSSFWTERIGNVAAIATLKEMKRIKSWQRITSLGKYLKSQWEKLSIKHDLNMEISGLDALATFTIKSNNWITYKTYITQEMLKNNFLAANVVYLSTAHTEKIIDEYIEVLDRIFERISDVENNGLNISALGVEENCHSTFKRLN